MKLETQYDLTKIQNKEIKKEYKEKCRGINKEIRTAQFDKKNIILSLSFLLAGISGLTIGINTEKILDNEYLSFLVFLLSGFSIAASPLTLFDIGNLSRQEKVEKLIEIRNQLDKTFKQQKISNKDKKILKKEFIDYL